MTIKKSMRVLFAQANAYAFLFPSYRSLFSSFAIKVWLFCGFHSRVFNLSIFFSIFCVNYQNFDDTNRWQQRLHATDRDSINQ